MSLKCERSAADAISAPPTWSQIPPPFLHTDLVCSDSRKSAPVALCHGVLTPTWPWAWWPRCPWKFTSQWEGWVCINTQTSFPLTETTLRCNHILSPNLPLEIKQSYPSLRLSLITYPFQPPSLAGSISPIIFQIFLGIAPSKMTFTWILFSGSATRKQKLREI